MKDVETSSSPPRYDYWPDHSLYCLLHKKAPATTGFVFSSNKIPLKVLEVINWTKQINCKQFFFEKISYNFILLVFWLKLFKCMSNSKVLQYEIIPIWQYDFWVIAKHKVWFLLLLQEEEGDERGTNMYLSGSLLLPPVNKGDLYSS